MTDYTVAQQPDGTFTATVTDDGRVVATLPGYKYEATARLAGYQVAVKPRRWHVENGRRVYEGRAESLRRAASA